MREAVLPGRVRVAFTREPDYFAADGLAGAEDVTVVSRSKGRVTGSGRCSIYPLLRNGVRQRIGYLGLLRIAEHARESPRLLRDGYELLRGQVHSRADGFFTSIATDNARARRVLELGGRLGLPAYRTLCDLVTLVAPVRKRMTVPGEFASADEVVELLARDTRQFQLSLAWDPALWQSLERHGLRQQDFAVVRRARTTRPRPAPAGKLLCGAPSPPRPARSIMRANRSARSACSSSISGRNSSMARRPAS
jgi:hypothetical protein